MQSDRGTENCSPFMTIKVLKDLKGCKIETNLNQFIREVIYLMHDENVQQFEKLWLEYNIYSFFLGMLIKNITNRPQFLHERVQNKSISHTTFTC